MTITVEYQDHMGSDLAVVNAAKVSFDKASDNVGEPEKRLINFLARGCTKEDYEALVDRLCTSEDPNEVKQLIWLFRNTPTHRAPFGHCFMSFRVTAPIFVARQLVKHEYLRMSEISRRYVTSDPEFFRVAPREAARNVKQGSGGTMDDPTEADLEFLHAEVLSSNSYHELLDLGVCPEQARSVLNQNLLTSWIWSGSLDAFAKMCVLRLDDHAQRETREVAKFIYGHMETQFPISAPALVEGV